MATIIWSNEAKSSFDQAISYIAELSPQNAMLVRQRILNTLSQLEAFTLGTPSIRGYRKLFIPKTSYFVIFSRDDLKNAVTLITFVHTSRDWENMDWNKIN